MKKVIVLGSKDSLDGLGEIKENNVEIIKAQIIDFVPVKYAFKDLSDFDWIFFGSKRGVRFFFQTISPEKIKDKKIACVGKKTAETLKEFDLTPDFIPSNYSSKHFFKEFSKQYGKVKGILFPTSDISKNSLEKDFKIAGILFKKIIVYKTRCLSFDLETEADAFLFLSPSSFKCFTQKNGYEILKNKIVCAIGKITAEEIQKEGIECLYPEKFTVNEALKLIFSKLGG